MKRQRLKNLLEITQHDLRLEYSKRMKARRILNKMRRAE